MPLPDENAVRLPPPPSVSRKDRGEGTGGVGQGGAGLPRKPGGSHVLPLRLLCGSPCACAPPPPPSASVLHCPYMQGCVHAFLVQACLCA